VLTRANNAQMASCVRSQDAAKLLHRLGKHTQQELFDLHERYPSKYAPANRPGTSTHEFRNDGVAYKRWRIGARIPWWAVGIDVRNADVKNVIHEARKEGFEVSQTYPSSISEYHHLNFRKPPRKVRWRARLEALTTPMEEGGA
jgi:Ni/Co efflux regulator RcnB